MDGGKENLAESSVLILVSPYRDYTKLCCASTTARYKELPSSISNTFYRCYSLLVRIPSNLETLNLCNNLVKQVRSLLIRLFLFLQ